MTENCEPTGFPLDEILGGCAFTANEHHVPMHCPLFFHRSWRTRHETSHTYSDRCRFLACCVALGQERPGPNYAHLKCFEQLIGTWGYDGPLQEDVPVLGGKNLQTGCAVDLGLGSEREYRGGIERGSRVTGRQAVGEVVDRLGCGRKTNHWCRNELVRKPHLSTVSYDDATKTWTTQSKGVDEKGRRTSATIVGRLTDADTYEWQMKDRKGGDVPGDGPKYIFKRIKQAK